MKKSLRLERCHAATNTRNLDKTWLDWKRNFISFLDPTCTSTENVNKLNILVDYVRQLLNKLLAKNCNFKSVISEVYKQKMIHDAFINDICLTTLGSDYLKMLHSLRMKPFHRHQW